MIKVVIVEDEQGIRESIAKTYPWNEMNCELTATASSGIEALEICLLNQPDIIISDIVMPGIDGLTFMHYIKEKYPQIHFIILTGHRNFDYAKDALNLGAELFMLKPIDYEALRQAIIKLVNQITNVQEGRRQENEREHVLLGLLEGQILHKSLLADKTRELLGRMDSFRIAAMSFDTDNSEAFYIQNLYTLSKSLISGSDVIPVRADNKHIAFFMLLQPDIYEFKAAQRFFLQLQQRVEQLVHITVSVGISGPLNGYEQAHDGYIEALRALEKRFFSGGQSVNQFIREEDLSRDDFSGVDFFIIQKTVQELLSLMSYTDSVRLVKGASELFDSMTRRLSRDIEYIKSSFIVTVMLCIREIVGKDARQIGFLLEKYANFRRVLTCVSLEQMREMFIQLSLDMADYVSVKSCGKTALITKVVSYIQDNYQRNIGLTEIAQSVYLTPSYLSTLVTGETGKGVIDILNETRVIKAAELLLNPSIKITDIAYQVGYREPQYFSVIFKKYKNMSPRAFRELYSKKR